MKSILIILLLTAALAIAGFFATAEFMRRQQNAAAHVTAPSGNSADEWDNVIRDNNRASGDLVKRQNAAMVGGGVGAGVGFLVGLLIARKFDRK